MLRESHAFFVLKKRVKEGGRLLWEEKTPERKKKKQNSLSDKWGRKRRFIGRER